MDITSDEFWSGLENKTIGDVIRQETLPIMVRVDEGMYGSDESQCFSQGDIIKLVCVHTIEQIIADNISDPKSNRATGCKSKNSFIPLRYKGMVKIQHEEAGKKIFNSVNELIKEFPKQVKVVETIFDQHNRELRARTNIELERESKSEELICKSKEQHFVLSKDQSGKFLLLPDSTLYTLEEIMQNFPMPQTVTFTEKDIPLVITSNLQEAVENARQFSRTYKLRGLQNQEVIVGHHKSCQSLKMASKGEQTICKPSVLIIPVDSEAAYIHVNLPLQVRSKDYELVMAKNFSTSRGVGEEFLNGTIYVEFDRIKKYAILNAASPMTGQPPTIPPRGDHLEGTKGIYDVPPPNAEKNLEDKKRTYEVPSPRPDDSDEDNYYEEVNKPKESASGYTTNNQQSDVFPERRQSVKNRLKKGVLKLFNPLRRSVSFSISSESADEKEFYSLGEEELQSKLRQCDLHHMATICSQEALDGAFFRHISDDEVFRLFSLDPLQRLKFQQLRNHGWKPNK